MRRSPKTVWFTAVLASSVHALGCSGRDEPVEQIGQSALAAVISDSDTNVFNVKLQPGASPSLPPQLQSQVLSVGPLFTLPAATLLELQASAGSSGPDLTRWYRIVVRDGTDVPTFRAALRSLDSVAYVENAPEGLIEPPAVTPNFEPMQGYLDAATDGLDARFAWTLPGGNGEGITVYDVEYNWNRNHEDLAKAAAAPVLLDPGDAISDLGLTITYHGTNVLGAIVGSNNGLGVTGIAWGADVGLAPENTRNLGSNRANAILLAVNDGSAGDILLLELQRDACGDELGPAEIEQAVFDATEVAVANGFVVVAAAGNGAVDLDSPSCGILFDRSVRDSGAILVGGGSPPDSGFDLEKTETSSFGERVDVQGWGAGVVTSGPATNDDELYVNADDPTNENFFYRSAFDGTSSASATVAGAAAAMQGFIKARFGTTLTSFQMRNLLRETGTPQVNPASGQIGPRPNLRAAVERVTQGPIDIVFLVDISGSYADDLPNFRDQAPTIMATLLAENSDIRFGLATFRDYPFPPFGTTFDQAYTLNQQLTDDPSLVEAAIDALSTFSGAGADAPESQLTALYQLATGSGQVVGDYVIPEDQGAAFRSTATKLILLWTDAGFHLPGDPGDTITYPGNSFVEAAEALLALDPPQVLGISAGTAPFDDLSQIAQATNSVAPAGGVDCDGDGAIDIQQGAPLVCMTDTSGAELTEVVGALVGAGLTNRQVDIGVTLTITSAAPTPLPIGGSTQVTLSSVVTNAGPSSSATASLAVQAMFGASISVTPTTSITSVDNLAVGGSRTVSQTYTVTCQAPGTGDVAFLAAATLTAPGDSYDPMPANDTDRAVLGVTCLAPVYAANLLDIRNRVLVDADVYGGNELRYGTDGNITGNVVVNGIARLWSRAHISGTLTVADFVEQQDGVVVDGGIQTGFSGFNLLIPTKTVTTGTRNLTLNNDQTATWTPGNYADGLVRARATLRLTRGVYNFRRLVLEPDVDVILDASGGSIQVNVAQGIDIGDRTTFAGGTAIDTTFYSNTTGVVRLGTDVTFTGALRVPRGEVHVYSRTKMPADVWADRIVLEPDTFLL